MPDLAMPDLVFVQCHVAEDCPKLDGGVSAGCCGGKCIDISSDIANCGGCGAPCQGGWKCCQSVCSNPTSDSNNCGGCGIPCSLGANALATSCAASLCKVNVCAMGFGDCDRAAANGCEVTFATAAVSSGAPPVGAMVPNCGACGTNCSADMGKQVSTVKCSGGACAVGVCATGYGDCDGNYANGCEAKCKMPFQTWTDDVGANEDLPMNCIDWYESFAFCVWDGGRLATEAEWNYAAAGGSDQRPYPWSVSMDDVTIDTSYAVYSINGMLETPPIGAVGSKSPKGDGKWGQADLSGGVWEWNFDWSASPYTKPCTDCANTQAAANRIIRGGSFYDDASHLLSTLRNDFNPTSHHPNIGARCARMP